MQNKQSLRETVAEAAYAFRAGRLDRRSFLALCGLAGVALPSVLAGRAEAQRVKS